MNKEQILKQVKLIFSSYLKMLHLDYLPSASSVERHDEIEGFFYYTYIQKWYNYKINFEIIIEFVHYIQYPNRDIINKSTVFIQINKYNNGKLQAYLSVNDYLQLRGIEVGYIENYFGKTFDEKINSFFMFFYKKTDSKLLKILKGEDWLIIPTYWGNYK